MAYKPSITSGFSINIAAGGAIVLAATKWTQNTVSEVRHALAAGQHKSLDSWPGAVTVNGSVDWIISDGDQDVLNVINPAGDPATYPACVMISETYKHTDAKMTSLKIDATVMEELKGSLSWEALAIDTDTNPGASTTNAFVCSKLTVTNLGTWTPVSWSVNVDCGIKPVHDMSATGVRLPAVLAEGHQKITFNCKLSQEETIPADMSAIALAQIASVTLEVEDTEAAPQALTITLTNVTPALSNKDMSPEDILMYGLDYEAEAISSAIA